MNKISSIGSRVMVGFAAIGLGISTAGAVTYTYQGNNFEDSVSRFNTTRIDGSYSTSNRVTGQFEIGALPANPGVFQDISGSVTSYSFTDGKNSFDNTNSVIFNFVVSFDSAGSIVDWAIKLGDVDFPSQPLGEGDIFRRITTQSATFNQPVAPSDQGSEFICLSLACTTFSDIPPVARQSGRSRSIGSWTNSIVAPVPLPATLPLLAAGLFGLGIVGRARRSSRRR